jgi:hypothetical protein
MGNWFKAHIVKARSRGDREEVNLQVFDRNGMALDLSTGGSGNGSGGEAPSFPMPLVVFDFSDRSSVVREAEIQGIIYPQPYSSVAPGFEGLLSQGDVSDWTTMYQSDALGGRSALVISSEDGDYLFVGDSETPIDSPVRFAIAKLDDVVAQRGLFGINTGDYSHLITWDDDGTVRWGVLFYFADDFHFRTTDAPVDTDLHVYCTNHAVDAAGIYIDGVLWPWTDEDPSGWLDRTVSYTNCDTFMGAGEADYPGLVNQFMPPLRLGELRIYDQDVYPFIAELSSLLKLKWQGSVVPSMEPLGAGIGNNAVAPISSPNQDDVLGWNNGEWGAMPSSRVYDDTHAEPVMEPDEERTFSFSPSESNIFVVEFRVEVLDGSIGAFTILHNTRNSLGEEVEGGAPAGLLRFDGREDVGGNEISTWTALTFMYGGDYGNILRAVLAAGSEGGSFRTRFSVTALR